VARCAKQTGAMLLLNSDTHKSSDILDGAQRKRIAQGAGLSSAEIDRIWENSKNILNSQP
jgi:signal recognition particle GTPase